MNMNSNENSARLLTEWETISRRIENIDARIWQGAGTVLIISVGGISLIGWHTPTKLGDIIFVLLASLISASILMIWWYMFHRWIHLQRIYSFRAREIEVKLDLWFNRYVRLIERWESEEEEKTKLGEMHPDSLRNIGAFWEKEHKKRRFTHVTIQKTLEWLTEVLWAAWVLFVLIYWVAYFWPCLIGL